MAYQPLRNETKEKQLSHYRPYVLVGPRLKGSFHHHFFAFALILSVGLKSGFAMIPPHRVSVQVKNGSETENKTQECKAGQIQSPIAIETGKNSERSNVELMTAL